MSAPKLKPTADTWVTKEGSRIRVKDMEDGHLVNTVRFLRRAAASRKTRIIAQMLNYADVAPEFAGYAVEREIAMLEEMPVDTWCRRNVPTWGALLAEIDRRGLVDLLEGGKATRIDGTKVTL